jgi:ribosomal protein S27AE
MQAQYKLEKVTQKGFKCSHCATTYMIAGETEVPTSCFNCGKAGTLVKTWGQTVTSTVTVSHD